MYEAHKGLTPEEIKAYLRKSRSDDALLTVEEVLAKHETILDEWAENNVGGKIAEENKYREVVSGETIDDRPEMLKLLKDIESPRVKAILVVEVQRLSRGDLEDAGRLMKLLRYTNTLVITPQRTYDLRDEFDRDYFERELKRGNEFLEYQKKIMNRGRLLSVQQGNYLGSKPPYGYERTTITEGKRKCPTLKIKEDEATIVRMIFNMYVNEGLGVQAIANHLDNLKIAPPTKTNDFWSPHAIDDMLINIHYIGKVKWNWRKTVKVVEDGEVIKTRPKSKIDEYLVYDGKHEAIISDELFNAAMERHGRNARLSTNTELRNPLAGLLFCSCGRAMTRRQYNNASGKEKARSRYACINQRKCNSGSCLYDEMIDLVKGSLEQCIEDFEIRINNNNEDAVKLHATLIKNLEKQLKEKEEKEIGLWDKYSEEGMPKAIFDKLNEKVLKEKDEINSALCKAKESMPDPVNYEEKLHRFKDALEVLSDNDAPAKVKNKHLKDCIARIEYTREKPVRTGGDWSTPPINIDVKLKL